MLQRRELHGWDRRWSDIDAAGGLFFAAPGSDVEDVRREIVARNIRSFDTDLRDIAWLADLPIEYLFLRDVGDASAVNTLTRLRGLAVGTWDGDIAFARLPDLEWFGVVEVEQGQLDGLWEHGHQGLRVLSVGRYREPDLDALERLPQLEDLAITDSRALKSLAGVKRLSRLQRLDLAICPYLGSLDGLDGAIGLESFVMATCNKIDDLGPVAELPNLRVVQIDQRKPPSLVPLVGHRTLEFVWIIGGNPPGWEAEALLENGSLRMLNVRRESWMRPETEWVHFESIHTVTPAEVEVYFGLLDELNRLK